MPVALAALVLYQPAMPQPCTFVLGFAALHDRVPETVEACAGDSRCTRRRVPSGGEVNCAASSSLAVILPDQFIPLTTRITIRACNGGRRDVTAVQAASLIGATILLPDDDAQPSQAQNSLDRLRERRMDIRWLVFLPLACVGWWALDFPPGWDWVCPL
jgi:hypothetical protein